MLDKVLKYIYYRVDSTNIKLLKRIIMTAHKTHKMKLLVALLAVGAVVLAPVAVGLPPDTDDTEITVNASGVLTVESATNAVTINLTPVWWCI